MFNELIQNIATLVGDSRSLVEHTVFRDQTLYGILMVTTVLSDGVWLYMVVLMATQGLSYTYDVQIITGVIQFYDISYQQPMSMAHPLVFDRTKVEKMLVCVSTCCAHEGQEDTAILLGSLLIIKESNVFGGTCIAVLLAHFIAFFTIIMEEVGDLDPTSDTDLFVLHLVFISRINTSLAEFISSWNLHPLRTERNWSPKKIWMNGVLDPANQGLTAIRDIHDPRGGTTTSRPRAMRPGRPSFNCMFDIPRLLYVSRETLMHNYVNKHIHH